MMSIKPIFFGLLFACGLINCASLGSSQVQFLGKCDESSYYDPIWETCRPFSGGGRVLYIEHNTTCDGFVGVKAYPETDKFYYVCQNDSVVIVECTGTLRFNSVSKQCEKSPCDELQLPKCETSGNFVVPDIIFSCCYTCQEVNDELVARSHPCSAYSTSRNKCTSFRKPATTEVNNGNLNGASADSVECYPPCSKPGQFRTPNNCSMYYTCSAKTNGRFYQTRLMCPAGFAYDITTEKCEPAEKVNCKQMSVGELLNLYDFYKVERERKNCNGNNANNNSFNIPSPVERQKPELGTPLSTVTAQNESTVKNHKAPVAPVPTDSNSMEGNQTVEVTSTPNIIKNPTNGSAHSNTPQAESQFNIGAESAAVPTSLHELGTTLDTTPATTNTNSRTEGTTNNPEAFNASIPADFSSHSSPTSTTDVPVSPTARNEQYADNHRQLPTASTVESTTINYIMDPILGLVDPNTLPSDDPMLGSTTPDSSLCDESTEISTSIISTTQSETATVDCSTVETITLANNLNSSESLKKDAESQTVSSTIDVPMSPTVKNEQYSPSSSASPTDSTSTISSVAVQNQGTDSTPSLAQTKTENKPTVEVTSTPNIIKNPTDESAQSNTPQAESQLNVGAESAMVPTSLPELDTTLDTTPATTNPDRKIEDRSDSPTTVPTLRDVSETLMQKTSPTQRTAIDSVTSPTQQSINSVNESTVKAALSDQNDKANVATNINESSTVESTTINYIMDPILGLVDPNTLPSDDPMLGSTTSDSSLCDESTEISTSIISTTQSEIATVDCSTVETITLANNFKSAESLKKDAESQTVSSTIDVPMSPTVKNEQYAPSSTASPTDSISTISSVAVQNGGTDSTPSLAQTKTETIQNDVSEVSTASPLTNDASAKETSTKVQGPEALTTSRPLEITTTSNSLTSPQSFVNASSETNILTDTQVTEQIEIESASILSSILMDSATTTRPQSSPITQAPPTNSTEFSTRIEKGNQTEMVYTEDFTANINETGDVHEVKMYFNRHTKVILEFDPVEKCTKPDGCGSTETAKN